MNDLFKRGWVQGRRGFLVTALIRAKLMSPRILRFAPCGHREYLGVIAGILGLDPSAQEAEIVASLKHVNSPERSETETAVVADVLAGSSLNEKLPSIVENGVREAHENTPIYMELDPCDPAIPIGQDDLAFVKEVLSDVPLLVRDPAEKDKRGTLGAGIRRPGTDDGHAIAFLMFLQHASVRQLDAVKASLEQKLGSWLGTAVLVTDWRPPTTTVQFKRGYFTREHGTLRPGLSVTSYHGNEIGATGSLALSLRTRQALVQSDDGTASSYLLTAGHVAIRNGARPQDRATVSIRRPIGRDQSRVVGTLDTYQWPGPNGSETLDVALFRIPDGLRYERVLIPDPAQTIPFGNQVAAPAPGQHIYKYGHSGYAFATMFAFSIDLDIRGDGANGPFAVPYTNVFLADSDNPQIAKPGDSGGLVATGNEVDPVPLGMIVAGSSKPQKGATGPARPYAICHSLDDILDQLKLTL